MAFNLTPGRGNFAKTGNGLPSSLKQTETDPPLAIAPTQKFNEGVQRYEKINVSTNQNRKDIEVNPLTTEATAKEFKRTVTNEGGYTTITGSGGQVFRGRTGMKATDAAVKASANKVNEINTRRNNNASNWNVHAGITDPSNYTESDKIGLIQTNKAVKVK